MVEPRWTCPECGASFPIPDVLTRTPQIVNFDLPGDGWSELVELAKKPGS